MVNQRPEYYYLPYISTTRRVIPGRFTIMELQNGETNKICDISIRGLLLNDLLKRGIPHEDAKTLFNNMTS